MDRNYPQEGLGEVALRGALALLHEVHGLDEGEDGVALGFASKFRQNVARFRLYPYRSLQVNTQFSAFFKIYQTIKPTF